MFVLAVILAETDTGADGCLNFCWRRELKKERQKGCGDCCWCGSAWFQTAAVRLGGAENLQHIGGSGWETARRRRRKYGKWRSENGIGRLVNLSGELQGPDRRIAAVWTGSIPGCHTGDKAGETENSKTIAENRRKYRINTRAHY